MQAEQPLPFGPFIAGAGFIALTTDYTFWGWLL
jgi:prepilin signal peptidase PulO-like enzyme (type II secretory pathway)